jgi:hypothetical protein
VTSIAYQILARLAATTAQLRPLGAWERNAAGAINVSSLALTDAHRLVRGRGRAIAFASRTANGR